MICVEVKKNDNDNLIGFHMEGHAGYAESGKDIICSAVSALVITCINSIETFTDAKFELETNEDSGLIDFTIKSDTLSPEANLLLLSLFHGLQGISESYGTEYVLLTNMQGGAKP